MIERKRETVESDPTDHMLSASASGSSQPGIAADSIAPAPSNPVSAQGNGVDVQIEGQYSWDPWSVDAQMEGQSYSDPLPVIQGQSSPDQWSVTSDLLPVRQRQSSSDQWSVEAQIQGQYSRDPQPQRSPPRRVYGGDHGGGYDRRREQNQTSLLVRNIPFDCRPEELRIAFERFGIVRDVYIPKNYYTGEPRGFAFVQFVDSYDASEAQRRMDREIFAGRVISIVVASEKRKRPEEMRRRTRQMFFS